MSCKIFGMPSFVHQKSRWFTIYLEIVNNFFKWSKQYNWNVVEDDIKLKAVWLKKKGFLLLIQLAMDESNFKLKHLNKLSSLNALNWPINISNSYKFIQIKLPQLKLWSAVNRPMYMQIILASWSIHTNQNFQVHFMTNKWN